MRCDLYYWNGINIDISGSKRDFISEVGKYFLAGIKAPGGHKADIEVKVCGKEEDMMPPIDPSAVLKKSIEFRLERDTALSIYSMGDKSWYVYRDIAEYCLDLKENRLVISLYKEPFTFYYYNILLLLLHPLGLLLENFGYNRIHASCAGLGGRAVLVTGVSGSGKSTAALALASRGAGIISDDITFIKRDDEYYYACGITRMVKLFRHTVEQFYPRLLAHDPVINEEGEMYFDERLINKDAVGRPRLDSILILEKTGRQASAISRVHPSKIITHIFPSSIQLNYGKYTEKKFDFLTGMLNDVSCYRVEFGTDMDEFNNTVVGMLGEGGKDV
jgi:hypothetical protein